MFETILETQKNIVFYSKRAKTIAKPEVLDEKLKTVLPIVILKQNFPTDNFTNF